MPPISYTVDWNDGIVHKCNFCWSLSLLIYRSMSISSKNGVLIFFARIAGARKVVCETSYSWSEVSIAKLHSKLVTCITMVSRPLTIFIQNIHTSVRHTVLSQVLSGSTLHFARSVVLEFWKKLHARFAVNKFKFSCRKYISCFDPISPYTFLNFRWLAHYRLVSFDQSLVKCSSMSRMTLATVERWVCEIGGQVILTVLIPKDNSLTRGDSQ